MTEPPPELSGPRLRLVPCAPEHRAPLRELHLTPEVRRWWQDPSDDWPEDETNTVRYTALLQRQVVGYLQWEAEEDPQYRHAWFDLFLDPALHGRGLGTEMARIICAHLVDDRDFDRLVIDPEVGNEVAIAVYRKVGFKPVGVMRRYMVDRHGDPKDGLLMDLLAEELERG